MTGSSSSNELRVVSEESSVESIADLRRLVNTFTRVNGPMSKCLVEIQGSFTIKGSELLILDDWVEVIGFHEDAAHRWVSIDQLPFVEPTYLEPFKVRLTKIGG